mmetsp:Transcript_9370/g.15808  ORF Transcript_9370/g.15808 Transcript_9370/m.15808 type:complete len:124 (-) Transcript_9370:936-1307(-)
MLYRQQPQQEQPTEQTEEKQEFGGGGGGGKPFIRFSSSSSMSSVVCRPDPNDPYQQICKTVTQQTSIDPETGKRTVRNVESEDTQPSFSSFFGGGQGILGSLMGGGGLGGFPSQHNDPFGPRS